MLTRKLTLTVLMIALLPTVITLPVAAQEGEATPEPQVAPETSQESTTSQAAEQPQIIVVAPELYLRAEQAFLDENYERAVLDYSAFILLNPTFSPAYYSRALSYQALGDLENALQDLATALEYDPDTPEYASALHLARAGIHVQQDNYAAALEDIDNAIEAAPGSPDAYLLRAGIYAAQNRLDDAVDEFDQVITLAPDFIPAYLGRGDLKAQLGNIQGALDDYSRALEIRPSSEAYFSRATIHIGGSDFQRALEDLDSAIALQPDLAAYYLTRAYVHTQMGNSAEATHDYWRWIDLMHTREIDADPLQAGQSVVLQMAQGVMYRVPFDAKQGQLVTARASSLAGEGVDSLLVILDSEGSPLISDDDSGGDVNAAIIGYVIPADGTYTLVVSHAGANPEGSIAVSLELEG